MGTIYYIYVKTDIRTQILMHPTLNGYGRKLHNRNPQMITDRQCGGRIWWWRS